MLHATPESYRWVKCIAYWSHDDYFLYIMTASELQRNVLELQHYVVGYDRLFGWRTLCHNSTAPMWLHYDIHGQILGCVSLTL